MDAKPQGQHYLPIVYLRRFCDKAGKLYLYDIEKEEIRPNINPEKIAKKKHIYTVTHNGGKDDYIENYLNDLEAKYGVNIRAIENGKVGKLTENDFVDIIWFLSWLYARNLSKVDSFTEKSHELLSFVGNGLLNNALRERGEENLRHFIKIKPTDTYVQKWAMWTMYTTARTMFNLLINEGEWFFYIAQENAEFITIDNPIENMVMIPLSKKIAFIRSTESVDGLSKRVVSVAPEWVNKINHITTSSAKRYIFASRKEILEGLF